MTEIPRIDATISSSPAAGPTAAPDPSAASPRFQEMLERLQRLAQEQRDPAEVDSPETLQDALRTADDGFVAAMDLRRQLEEAFRKHMP